MAYALLGIVLLTMATDMLLWQVIGVPRPSGPQIIVQKQASVSSFPSGRTMVATTVWGLLAVYTRMPKLAAVGIVLGVMLSRLYLSIYYVGDVLGGALIGLILVYVYTRCWPSIARWFARQSFRFFMLLGLGLAVAVLPFTFITALAWLAFGGALGAAIGLLSEYRSVRYVSRRTSVLRQALKGGVRSGRNGCAFVRTHHTWLEHTNL